MKIKIRVSITGYCNCLKHFIRRRTNKDLFFNSIELDDSFIEDLTESFISKGEEKVNKKNLILKYHHQIIFLKKNTIEKMN